MPSKSKSQQRFFGLVRKCQKTGDCANKKIKKIANNISQKDARDFAKTKHKGLPNKKRKTFKEYVETNHPEFYKENVLGLLTNLGLGAAAVLKTAMKKKSSWAKPTYNYDQNVKNFENKEKPFLWTNKEKTEQLEGFFVKKENNVVFIKLLNNEIKKIPINWFSEESLKYIEAIMALNKIKESLNSIKLQIHNAKEEVLKNNLLKDYEKIKLNYKQAEEKVRFLTDR